MLKLEFKLLGLSINLDINFKKPKNKKETKVSDEKEEFTPSISEINADYPIYTHISEQAERFAQELANQGELYDIPSSTDLPPRYNINDDVEVITDDFEKEIEKLYNGER